MGWLRKHPLAAFLPLQAILYCWNLAMLSPWMDEAGTLGMVRHPLGDVIQIAATDIHPPLYFLLLYYWQKIPLGLAWATQARLISVLFALLGTVALDGFWGAKSGERTRFTVLALWTFSPCLLLYARMCRSYSLQALFGIVVVGLLLEFLESATWQLGALLGLALLGALYTHYAAGIALIVVANLGLAWRRQWRAAVLIDCVIGVGYLPWIWRLAASLGSWGSNTRGYTLTGNAVLEVLVKMAYWAASFLMGEAVPDGVLLAGAMVAPLMGWMVWRGARRSPDLAWVGAGLAAIGFVGVARWVSYPFVPARLLFVLPFFILLVARGAAAKGRWGTMVVAAMLLFSASGTWCYFHRIGFRNKQYPIPVEEIVTGMLKDSGAADSAILVDSTNSDPVALAYALDGRRPFLETSRPETEAALAGLLADPRVRTVWFLRNTHDVSPGRLDERFELELRARMTVTVHYFGAYTALERKLMGRRDAPQYFHELLEFRR